MKDKFTQILDWIEKFIKRFRAFIFLILGCVIIFSLVTGRIDKNQALKSAKETAEKISGLNFEKDLLFNQKEFLRTERDSLQIELYYTKEERDVALELKEQAEWQSAKDTREKNEAIRVLRHITSDSSHIFNQTIAYPFSGEKKYGYNARQVSGIHKTFVENEFNKDIINDQKEALDYCNEALSSTMEIESINDEVSKSFEEEISVDSIMLDIEEEKNDIIMDEWKKNKRKERWSKIWRKTEKIIYAVGGFALGVLIAK